MFDKKAYWERRKKGLRGQEDLTPKPTIAKWTKKDHKKGKCGVKAIGSNRTSDVTMLMTKKGLKANPRRQKRYRLIDRTFTSSGFAYGHRVDGKIFGITRQRQKKTIGTQFGKIIQTEVDGKVVKRKYSFPAKTRHLRNVTEEQRRHWKEQDQIFRESDFRRNETNHQRAVRQRKARDAANQITRTTASAA